MIYNDYFKYKAGQILLFIIKAHPIASTGSMITKTFNLIVSKYENERNYDMVALLSTQQKMMLSKTNKTYVVSHYNWFYEERLKKKTVDDNKYMGIFYYAGTLYELHLRMFVPRFPIPSSKESFILPPAKIKLSHSSGKCSYINCNEPAYIDGLCWKHYHMERTTK